MWSDCAGTVLNRMCAMKSKKAYRILYCSNYTISQAIEQMEQELQGIPEIDHFIRFLRSAERGILR